MQSVLLGDTSCRVSALCLGTDHYGSRTSPDQAFELLDAFAAAGGTFLDTANAYAAFLPGFVGGESEQLIGDWMRTRGIRQQMVVGTKVAAPYQEVPRGLRAGDIERECEKSLRRLGSDVIDVYYAHVDDRNTPLAEIVQAFDRLVRAGKVRWVGASNWMTWRLAEARLLSEINGWARLAALEFRHTYLRPGPAASFGDQVAADRQLFDFARAHGLTVLAYSALLGGMYGRAHEEVPRDYRGPDTDTRLAVLRSVAAEVGATPNQVVIAWLLQCGEPLVPIVGGSTVAQVRENLAAASLRLSSEQVGRLTGAGDPPPAPPR
ncbi:MAG: aldo/keto reductase [Friedmanniella sp.]|nr:aldo/keto reductase [Friedmanniella sp.]